MTTGVRGLRSRAAPLSKALLLRSGGYAAIRRLLPSRRVAILRYHAICGEEGYSYADPAICVSPNNFEQHVRYLAAHYSVLALPDIVSRMANGRPLPANTVALTFDDGYADNLEASRTLHRHGLTATFYITAGCLADGEPFWPSEIRALIPSVRRETLELRLDDTGERVALPLSSVDDQRRAISRLTKLFKSHPVPVRESLRDQLRRAANHRASGSPMLGWDDVREMHRLGMTIGAHTLTHPNLPSAGLETATQEIEGSRARLQRELDAEVTMFSYPNGGAERYFTAELQAVVKHAGFTAATTSRNGFASRGSDLYALERIQVSEALENLLFALEVERFVFRPETPSVLPS